MVDCSRILTLHNQTKEELSLQDDKRSTDGHSHGQHISDFTSVNGNFLVLVQNMVSQYYL